MRTLLLTLTLLLGGLVTTLYAQEVPVREPEVLPFRIRMTGVSFSHLRVPEDPPALGYRALADWLQGRIPGVQVLTGGNRLPHEIRVIMRANTCILCRGVPMVFIDGLRVDEMQLGLLSPEEVYSVTVLKGPAATALYGTGAAEGVILIETVGARFVSQR